MAKDRNGSISKEEIDEGNEDYKDRHKKSKRKKDDSSDSSDDDRKHRSKTKKKRSHRYDDSSDDDRKLRRKTKKRRSHRYDDSSSSYDSDTESGSESESLDLPVLEESEGERRRRKRRERESKERRRREKKKREKEERRKKKEKDKKKKKKKKDENVGKKGAVTNSWGKYGIIRETDMWNKRPEFTAWLTEVKQVNPETLPNWEEKQMFKEFMEDHNTATFPSNKFYDLDAYHCRQMEKEAKKGLKRAANSERTVFDDEEQRRLELQRERNRQKEEEIEALKRSMQSGMAQAMKDQARLREEMAYQYKLGNFEAAAAIQRRLDPDVAM